MLAIEVTPADLARRTDGRLVVAQLPDHALDRLQLFLSHKYCVPEEAENVRYTNQLRSALLEEMREHLLSVFPGDDRFVIHAAEVEERWSQPGAYLWVKGCPESALVDVDYQPAVALPIDRQAFVGAFLRPYHDFPLRLRFTHSAHRLFSAIAGENSDEWSTPSQTLFGILIDVVDGRLPTVEVVCEGEVRERYILVADYDH